MFLACGSATAVTVSFETGEGFPDGDGASISGSVPAGVVTGWSLTGDGNKGTGGFEIDHGPGGTGFGDEANPLTGSQFGLARGDDNGEIILTMDLDNAASNTLQSLYYANRGTYPPQLTLEYYGLDENLLGSDVFTARQSKCKSECRGWVGPGGRQHARLQSILPADRAYVLVCGQGDVQGGNAFPFDRWYGKWSFRGGRHHTRC